MLAKSRIVAIIPSADLSKSRTFYEDTLGLKFSRQDEYAMIFESGANAIRVSKVGPFVPSPHPVLGWEVSEIETVVKDLTLKGLTFERYEFLKQDDLGIWTGPDESKVAFFKDPDGNLLSISKVYC